MKRLLGVKKDMTQIFAEDGSLVPVTIIDIKDNALLGTRTMENDGYQALILGLGRKKSGLKSETGKFKEIGYVPSLVVESRDEVIEGELKLGIREFEDMTAKKVHVTGTTKGKGFQGGMKRWGFSGGKKTHGQSDRMRAPGSIGSGTTPGRVYKGKKMAGHMGTDRMTIKNLRIIKHLQEENLLLVKGAVPGAKGSKVIISVLG